MGKGNRSNRRERKDRQIREKEAAIKKAEEAKRQKRNSWLRLGGYVLAGVLTAGAIAGTVYSVLSRKPRQDYSVSESGLEKKVEEDNVSEKPLVVPAGISFEQAKANLNDEAFVQKYLDHILENVDVYGIEGWDSFGEFIYDPGFKKRKKVSEKDNDFLKESGYDHEAPDITALMCVYIAKDRLDKPVMVYINNKAFQYCRSEDEFFSLLDNEAFTARGVHKREAHLDLYRPDKAVVGKKSKKLFRLECEILSYELQFTYIENGTRDVSEDFLRGVMPLARRLMKKLIEIANEESTDAQYAKGIIATLNRRPTIKYFEPNRGR